MIVPEASACGGPGLLTGAHPGDAPLSSGLHAHQRGNPNAVGALRPYAHSMSGTYQSGISLAQRRSRRRVRTSR